MKRIWIKLYLEILDDDEFGELSECMKWRAIELFLVAGENGDDGLLPPVKRLAWRIRLSEERVEETLSALSQVGVVNHIPEGWQVTNFKKRQYSESYERVKRYRNGKSNADVTAEVSSSSSDSNSLKEEEEKNNFPKTPAEASKHPDIKVFKDACGRIPGTRDYRVVIDTIRFLRDKQKITDKDLSEWLKPFWLAWSSRKRNDGQPYDPANMTWFTEWAMNGQIPTIKVKKQVANDGPKEHML